MGLDDSDDETFCLVDENEIGPLSFRPSLPPSSWSSRLYYLLVGQVASVMLCLSGAIAILLYQYKGPSTPVQNWISYFLVSAFYTSWTAYRPRISSSSPDETGDFLYIVKTRGWMYLMLSIVDSAASYFLVSAYEYTSLTSVQLLSCMSIPTSLVLSYVFLKVRYRYLNYIGIILSLSGAGFLIQADVGAGVDMRDGTSPIYGDILTLVGATLFGISNVGQEFFVKNFSPYEYLGFSGFFATFISAFVAFATVDFEALRWDAMTITLLMSFGLAKFLFWSAVAYLMVESNSVAVNLAILTAGFYSLMIGIYIFNYAFNTLYIVAFLLFMAGVGVFSLQPVIPSDYTASD